VVVCEPPEEDSLVRPRPGTRPARALPALHSLQLRARIHLHHAVYLAVRMAVVLAAVLGGAIHVHGCDTHKSRRGFGEGDFGAAVFGAWEGLG
jgi:hypothetical protein